MGTIKAMPSMAKGAGAFAFILALAATALLAATAVGDNGISQRGIDPDDYPGNFVASDDQQVCFELEQLGYIGEVTTDMYGFKIDPPVNFDNGDVKVTISNNGRYLDWETSAGVTMLAVIVKGGPNYHVYDYVGSGFAWDKGLHSPVNRRNVPAISHYNFCYTKDASEGDQGCTPGYWRNHADRWLGVAPGDDYDGKFGVNAFDPDITLGDAVQLGGGGVNALARHSVAALLNAYGGTPNPGDGATVEYPYTVAQVIAMVQAALADGGDVEGTKDLLDAANNVGCPLGGTSGNPV